MGLGCPADHPGQGAGQGPAATMRTAWMRQLRGQTAAAPGGPVCRQSPGARVSREVATGTLSSSRRGTRGVFPCTRAGASEVSWVNAGTSECHSGAGPGCPCALTLGTSWGLGTPRRSHRRFLWLRTSGSCASLGRGCEWRQAPGPAGGRQEPQGPRPPAQAGVTPALRALQGLSRRPGGPEGHGGAGTPCSGARADSRHVGCFLSFDFKRV